MKCALLMSFFLDAYQTKPDYYPDSISAYVSDYQSHTGKKEEKGKKVARTLGMLGRWYKFLLEFYKCFLKIFTSFRKHLLYCLNNPRTKCIKRIKLSIGKKTRSMITPSYLPILMMTYIFSQRRGICMVLTRCFFENFHYMWCNKCKHNVLRNRGYSKSKLFFCSSQSVLNKRISTSILCAKNL